MLYGIPEQVFLRMHVLRVYCSFLIVHLCTNYIMTYASRQRKVLRMNIALLAAITMLSLYFPQFD